MRRLKQRPPHFADLAAAQQAASRLQSHAGFARASRSDITAATKEDVANHFGAHGTGKITEIKLMNGFGFIEYEDMMDARDVVPGKHGWLPGLPVAVACVLTNVSIFATTAFRMSLLLPPMPL